MSTLIHDPLTQAFDAAKGKTRQIPRAEWRTFFDSFSRQHEGWLASLELLAPDLGALTEVYNRPLAGITAELHRSGRDSITIIFGRIPSELTHIVSEPTRVWLKQTAEGADDALEIESAQGPTALLRFRSPRLSEEVDGMIAWGEP
ncbi:MAG: DUF5335 family protein [Terriglobales bacterium]